MAVLAVVEDLLFRSKLETAARLMNVPLQSASAAGVLPPGNSWTVVVVDLGVTRIDPLALVAELRRVAPHASLVAFGAHVDQARLDAARAAGYAHVLSHAELMARLPNVLQGRL